MKHTSSYLDRGTILSGEIVSGITYVYIRIPDGRIVRINTINNSRY